LCYALEDFAAAAGAVARRCRRGLLIALGAACGWLALGPAQALASGDFAAAPASLTSGWWSPAQATSTPAPHLELNLAALNHFGDTAAVPTSPQPADGEIRDYLLNAGSFELTRDPQSAEWQALAQGQTLPPESFLGLVQSKYTRWETNLAETRTPMDINGQSVYPLVQISYGQWTLPIGLYTPPLRGSARW
jgi:hypothetical protein